MINIKPLVLVILLVPIKGFGYAYSDINVEVDINNGLYPFSDASYWDFPEIYGSSKVDWISGPQAYSRFRLYDTSELDLLGGSIDGNIGTYDNAIAIINGGSVDFAISARDLSKLYINSGTVRFADSFDSSEIIFSGGMVATIAVKESSTLTVVGNNLNYTYTGRNDVFGYDRYLLTGSFQAGGAINTDLFIYDGFSGQINLATPTNIPEPSTPFLILVSLVGFMYVKQKKHSIAVRSLIPCRKRLCRSYA